MKIELHTRNLKESIEEFASKNKIKEKFPFNFKEKEKILGLISNIEKERNKLCYGKPQSEKTIADIINNFNELRKKFEVLANEKL